MEVNDQINICLGISRINDSLVLQKLATHNIFISDSSANNKLCLFEKPSDEIHILLGSDIVEKLFTGEIEASWDSKLPIDIERKFETWKKQLIGIQDLKVPRRLSNLDLKDTNLSLQVFCDASKLLYTTCVFLRAEREGEVTCQLIQARSKVVPLKGTSIPGLELLACTIGARIADSVKKDLHMENVDVTYWSDSMDALHWIKRDGPWATFVANRVEEITPVFTANLTSS
ncbi:integrase catalytic domain-containing protein [Trichonephila inaurata madagascariensis]|uniref:Integrase catalytic domain-containing protein n=1 Tax=Trichonephila inaurata madagascariensis TaxID=2747483 RepID=A0A8X6WLK5_9ARAC|nr:integrase catalytic domain-containing protein [Trichonephila inaurata madagascariensis]